MDQAQRLLIAPLAVVTFGALLAALACGGGDDSATAAATDAPAVPPTASPADESTPTPDLPPPVEGGYRLSQTMPQATFSQMLGLRPIPGSEEDVAVITQTGQVWRVNVRDDSPAELLADLSGRLIDDPAFEEGLLGLEFSPGYEDDGLIYVHYSAGGPRRGVIARFSTSDGVFDLASEEVILEVAQPFPNHNGGEITFGPDGYLYIALGDGGSGFDPQGHGQNLATLLGSVLRIDVSVGSGYSIPADNPFVDVDGARPEIFAYGLRNPWRFSFDRATGDLWTGDVGQDLWEEVGRVEAGGNYGWVIMEGPECVAPGCDQTGLELPRAAYTQPGRQAVIGGYVYRGEALPELRGYYLYGDFVSGDIWAVNTRDESDPILLASTGLPITSFGQLADGEVVVVTFANAVYEIDRIE